MTENPWPNQHDHSGYYSAAHPYPTAQFPPPTYPGSGYGQATGPLPNGTPAYFSNYGPSPTTGLPAPTGPPVMAATSPPSSHWPLVVVAVVMSGLIGAAVAIYYAAQVGRRWTTGDVQGAAKASRLAKIWAITGITVGAFLTVVAIAAVNLAGLPAIGTTASQVPVEQAPQPAAAAGVTDPTLEEPAGLDSSQTILFDAMRSDLQLAVDRLGRGEDPTSQCISVLVTAEGFATGFESAAAKATEQCGREIPIAWATHQLDAAEAKGDPFDAILECATAQVTLDSVEKRFADPRVGELRTRTDQVCG